MFASNDNDACLLVFRTIYIDTTRFGCHVTVIKEVSWQGTGAYSAVAFSQRIREIPPGCHCKRDCREPRISPSMKDRLIAVRERCFWSVMRVLAEPLDHAYRLWHATMFSLFHV